MINYNEETHTYTKENGEQLVSVTEIATKICHLNKTYLEAHPEFSARGTDVHTELANYYDNDDPFDTDSFTQDASRAIAQFMPRHKDNLVEQMLWNLDKGYAGTADLVRMTNDVPKFITDFKSGKVINKKYCTIQLNLYRLALEFMGYDVSETKMYVINPVGITEIEPKSWDELMALEATELEPNNPDELDGIQQRLLELEPFVSEYNTLFDAFKKNLIEQMESAGATNFYGTRYYATLVPATRSLSLDADKVKQELGDKVEDFMKVTNRSAYIKITKQD